MNVLGVLRWVRREREKAETSAGLVGRDSWPPARVCGGVGDGLKGGRR